MDMTDGATSSLPLTYCVAFSILMFPTESWDRHWGCVREEEAEREAELQALQVVSG